MARKRLGRQTVKLQHPPSIISTATTVGPKEGEGPLSHYFDVVLTDDLCGENSWELSESKMLRETIKSAIQKADKNIVEIEYLLSGDLLNQLMAASFAARDLDIPFLGLYGACSTMTESLSIGAMLIDGGYANYVAAATSSHFSSAERQFRFPLELGNQRSLTAQWTVTGAGAAILAANGSGPYISHVTTGKVIDLGIKDVNNMGAAMAPAAADTITAHFEDTGFKPEDYDLIVTGDLGAIGKEIAEEIVLDKGYNITKVFNDCGLLIFDNKTQDTHAGGSGCGCSASVFCSYIFKEMINKKLNKVLLISTGALLSSTSALQGQSIPSIAHAVTITNILKH
ncbi:stage V sporulation protein AD [Geosporobacter ferrireducens]|uniref:Stage V sporulation protein AD n=1 Tax=Geosporobacter ferrireducens TaxID=1424294 RepID=A0A1D8GCM8_9FIRM|nr:stage V sporulation protein AD [Geosporobacter ferrireducens]AOT68663.1 stage V sporulation protein AD [Geosporobacter ferrireducens]MTI54138.1 stage V sporulation protein AD [Geosporobacter ferrireducens]